MRLRPETESRLQDWLPELAGRRVNLWKTPWLDTCKSSPRLESRYDDLKSGRVPPLDWDQAFADLRRKRQERRNRT